ncbi:MAG: hypothetical protein C4526_11575 [Nitrospiraceae bacterium]|nr:MAG: hypothetical protein C4526_11575 [Nitrospiraceae bacterium]
MEANMKKLLSALSVLIFVTATVAYAIHQVTPAETYVPFPGPHAEAVFKYITAEDPYNRWDLWPGKGKLVKGRPPLDIITTYVNDNALYSIKAGKKTANGSIIVTENYAGGKKLSAVFVMYKIRGYNPPAGDWYWAQYDANGKTVTEGKVGDCIGCHAKMKENDYIFTDKFVR